MAAVVMSSMDAAALGTAADVAVHPDATVATVVDELFWLVVGFLIIQALAYLGYLPQFSLLGNLAPAKASKGKVKALSEKKAKVAGEAPADLLKIWDDALSTRKALPGDLFKDCARALAAADGGRAARELAEHLAACGCAQPSSLNVAVEVVAQAAGAAAAESLIAESGLAGSTRTREILVETFAVEGAEARVLSLLKEDTDGRSMTAAVRGFTRAGHLEAAVGVLAAATERSVSISPRTAADLLKAARAKGPEVLVGLLQKLGDRKAEVPVDCLAALLDDCLSREDVSLAGLLEALAFKQDGRHFAIFEPLLKLHAKVGGTRAPELFEQLLQAGLFASEGLCGKLLASCGERHNLKFAETIVGYLRQRHMMSLSIFKTLMKVYATCGRYDDACDLYEQVLAEGLEPDDVMYGCLVKFAVKCGRHKLSQDLFGRTRRSDAQNYMWMIRAASQEGDATRAVQLLREAEASKTGSVDVMLYNATLDACVSHNKMAEARELVGEMASKGLANLISYNTLMKGYCAGGDVRRARGVLNDMDAAGLVPDSASYNCLLATVVSSNSFAEAWSIMDEMKQKRVAVDHYTVSIMMKVAKRAHSAKDSARALAVLDEASGVNVFSDDVLFNTVLDALISRHDLNRLGKVLRDFANSDAQPTIHTYGLLIKASSMLRRVNQCWDLWRDMVEVRRLIPNTITLSCMMDALVCGRQTEHAVALLDEWKSKVATNTVMYATLIKGFATAGQPERAMEVHRQLVEAGHEMNLVAYTSLIDAHARVGRMQEARALLKKMEEGGCEPNVITFSAIVKGYCMEGDLTSAFDMFKVMQARGLRPDTVIVNTLLDGCVRHSGFDLADSLLESMEAYGVEPSNFTISIIIKMWGKRRQLDRAFAAVRKAELEGGRCLDTQVGTCLISACFLNQAPERALDALAELKRWKCCSGPDAGSYSTLITGLARKEMAKEAADVAEEAIGEGFGCVLAQDSLQLLQKALQRRGQEDRWQHLQVLLRAPLAEQRRAARPAGASAPARSLAAAAPGSLTSGLLGRNGAARLGNGGNRGGPSRSSQDWMTARKAADRR